MTTVTITETIQTVEISDGTTVTIVEPSVEIVTVGTQGPQGIQGPTGPAGVDGSDGADGVGVPIGGSAGQVLAKASGDDYDTEWSDVVGGVSSFNTRTGDVTPATDDYTAAQINASGLTNAKMVYVGSGRFTSAAALEYAASGTHLTIAAQGATDIPLLAKGASGQSANLQEWQNSSGNIVASVNPSGRFESKLTGYQSVYFGLNPTTGSHGVWGSLYGAGYFWGILGTYGSGATNQGNQGWRSTATAGTGAYGDLEPTINTFGIRWNNDTRLARDSGGGLIATSTLASAKILTVKGASGQSANLTECQDSGANIQLAIGPSGQIKTNQTSAGTTLGSVTNKMPVYNAAGTLVGYVPIYDSIT